MIIPQARLTVQQQGVPNTYQRTPDNINGAFLNQTDQLALGLGQQITNTAGQLINAKLLSDDIHQQQQIEQASKFRVNDAFNELQLNAQDIQSEFIKLRGKAVFDLPDRQSLHDSVLKKFDEKRLSISEGLADDFQKQAFNAKASELGLQIRGRVIGHEAEQYRTFQASTLAGTIENAKNNINLFYNDPDQRSESVGQIIDSYKELSRLEGKDEALGEAKARGEISNILKSAINASLQNQDYESAGEIRDQFHDQLDLNDLNAIQDNISSAYASRLLQENPEELKRLTDPSDLSRYADAIASIESGGSYTAVGVKTASGDQALGRYQVMGANLPEWSKAAVGRAVSKEEFLSSPELQDAIFKDRFGKFLKEHGNPQDAASVWLSGRPRNQAGDVEDALGTNVSEYVQKFNKALDHSPIDGLSFQKQLSFNNAASAQVETVQRVFKAKLNDTIQNQLSEAMYSGHSGETARPEQFQQAFGEDWQSEYQKYNDNLSFASTYFGIAKTPSAIALQQIEDAKPKAGALDNDQRQKNYQHLTLAFQQATKERDKDPVVWAQNEGYPVGNLNIAQPRQAVNEIRKRLHTAEVMSNTYNSPFSVLKKEEAKQLSVTLDEGTIDEKLGVLQVLNADTSRSSLEQVMPEKPALMVAGILMDKNEQVARAIVKGDNLLNPPKSDGKGASVKLPSDLEKIFYEKIGDAYGDDIAAQNMALAAVKSHYVATNTIGEANVDEDKLIESISAVNGGDPIERNGFKIFAPYGINKNDFIEAARDKFILARGGNEDDGDLFDEAPLTPYGANQYAVRNGNSFYRDSKGRAVILDFN